MSDDILDNLRDPPDDLLEVLKRYEAERKQAAAEIERLREDLRLAIMSDSEYCKTLETDNERLRKAHAATAIGNRRA